MHDCMVFSCCILIILIIYLIYLFAPRSIWASKFIRKIDRFHNKYFERFTGIKIHQLRLINFYKGQADGNKTIIGLHYTNWCPHCTAMKPEWKKMKALLENDSKYKFIEIDEDEQPTPGIEGFPTIMKYKDGQLTKYEGPKDSNQLIEFAQSS